ncbi:dephospho-CoA kinase [Leptospira ryugenii]|uniref:Dephospho-CoA kinase n=1 Tax=Leptospira ryugenii TaxID=1917863 RepID=A0A2P2DXN0_9LEPT|nr:dephospho-CoA kinase [Leptospira ryugenii]GBF49381.1 dephospho-CoA kinase [Leptospira ryugenii]
MAYAEDRVYLIGITGSIGSGKSTVAKLFESFGAFRISSDEIAKGFTDPDSPIKGELRAIFGSEIFDSLGNPIKQKIADLAFSDPNLLSKLNELIHPLVRKEFKRKIQSLERESLVAWEVPLLFETDAHTLCDFTVCVYTSPEIAQERAIQRGGMTREDYEKRKATQLPIEEKKALSQFSIPNDNSIEDLKKSSWLVFQEIKNKTKVSL